MFGYNIDIVMCISATSSMSPIIDELKCHALAFCEKTKDAMEKYDIELYELRIKIIVFRGCLHDGENMCESRFFLLPEENTDFAEFVNNIEVYGIGDNSNNALEAVALAMKSDWSNEGDRYLRRNFILVFSDAPACLFGDKTVSQKHAYTMPSDINQLRAWWEGTNQTFERRFKRHLLAFVPNVYPWNEMIEWNRCWPHFFNVGEGLYDLNMQTVIDLLVDTYIKTF